MRKPGYYAAIDVGSNAVRRIIKDVYGRKKDKILASTVQEVRIPIRLGADVFSTGSISFRKEQQLIDTRICFRSLRNIYSVTAYKAYATSARREAKNGEEVIERIKKESGIDRQIVSGTTEANTITYILKDLHLDKGVFVAVDVGGGSTEVSLIVDGKDIKSDSFPIGTLRILAGKDKKETWSAFKDTLKRYHDKYDDINIIATGGNINRYWKLSEHKSKQKVNLLDKDELFEIYDKLSSLSTEERKEKYSLKPDRADVIVPAGEIFITACKCLDSDYLYVPMTGLGDGIVNDLILGSNINQVI